MGRWLLRSQSPRRVRREGLVWLAANLAIVRLGGLIVTLLLRRLLGPGVSGVFDLASTPYRLFDSFRNFGVGPVLVVGRGLSRAEADTAWTFNMALAVVLAIGINLLAHPIAVFYRHPGIEGLLRVLSLAYILAAACSVHGFLLLRRLDLRARTIPAVGATVIAGAASVMLALWSDGTAPLVLRELLAIALGAALLWLVCPYVPRVRIDRGLLAGQLRYSFWIGAGLSSLYVAQNADVFVAGRIIRHAADVGFYTTSWRLTFIMVGVVSVTATSAVFPALSRSLNDPGQFEFTLLLALRQTALGALPAAFLLAAAAPVLVVPVLGPEWRAYRQEFLVISILSIYGGGRALTAVLFEGFKAIGKPWLLSAYNLGKAVVLFPAMSLAAPQGIRWLAAVYIPVLLVELPAALLLAGRVFGLHAAAVWRAVRVPLLSAAIAAAMLGATERLLLSGFHAGGLRTLIVSLAVGVAAYLALVQLLAPQLSAEVAHVLVMGFTPSETETERRY